MNNIAVISLTEEYERRQHIDTLFNEHELEFSYFDAINKTQMINTLKKYELAVNTESMSAGEIACYLSHYCLWQQVVEQNMPYLIVFEDDIYFSKSAKQLLNKLDWLPNSFDVIKLETMYERVLINKGIRLPLAHKLCRMKSRHMGMAGYIISYKGAEKLLAIVQETGIDRPIDHVMFDRLVIQNKSEIYQLFPALCIQDKIYNKQSLRFKSSIEEIRKQLSPAKIKPTRYQKFSRELGRLFQQVLPKSIYEVGWLTIHGYKKRKISYRE